jgi:hypothetical protein
MQEVSDISLVNQFIEGSPLTPETSSLADGGYVVVWNSANQDGNSNGIFAQRFNDQGNAVGNEFVVNTENFGAQTDPSVAGLNDGSFVVTWTSRESEVDSDINVYGQRFDANGDPIAEQFIVNTLLGNSQTLSQVDALPSGGFVVTYTTNDSNSGDNSGLGIAMRYFDANGVAVGDEILVNENIASTQSYPDVAVSDTAVLVAWKTSTGDDIQARIFNPVDGTAITSEFTVNTNQTGDVFEVQPNVIALDDGNFLVTWSQRVDEFGGNYSGIRMQKVGADGALIGSELIVNSDDTSVRHIGEFGVAELNNGNVIVTWSTNAGTYTQEIDVSVNTPVLADAPILIGNNDINDRYHSVVELGGNSAAVIWTEFNTAGNSTYEIVQQIVGRESDFVSQSSPSVENLSEELTILESDQAQLLFTGVDILDTDSTDR